MTSDYISMNASLAISGLVPFSATDFPGQLAAVIFCQGCPWRCRYCHNHHLQSFSEGKLSTAQLDKFLASRVGLLDAIVFSGGEATAQTGLKSAMERCKQHGYKVGLHTMGYAPDRLRPLLSELDWIGLDIKAPLHKHEDITGLPGDASLQSLEEIGASGIPYEVRTTYHPDLFAEQDLLSLARLLRARGVENFALQLVRGTGCKEARFAEQPSAVSQESLHQLREIFPKLIVR